MMPMGATNTSIWEGSIYHTSHASLQSDLEVDVVIIGAGITGLTAAYYLKKQGKKIAILEADHLGAGTSGKTTAHLTTLFDHSYDVLESKYGEEAARLVARGMQEAIDRIESLQSEHAIACDFERLSGYYYTEEKAHMADVDKVFAASKRAGLDVTLAPTIPLPPPFATKAAFEIKNQAQFHILAYLEALADLVIGDDVQMYEQTRVLDVTSGSPCEVKTENATVTAKKVIMATHTPLGRNLLHSAVAPYRSYVVAAKIRGEAPHGLFWDTCEPYNYIRSQKTPDGTLVIIGGKDRKVGHGGEEDAFAHLRAYAEKRFDVAEFVYQWSAQYYDPADHLPFIGTIPFSEHVYTGTGYSGDGMTLGSLAGYMIAEQIAGRATAYDQLFRPARINSEGLPTFFRENLDVAKGLVLDRFLPSASSNLESMQIGEGRIFRSGASKYAAYRKDDGEVAVFSAICPHMKCVVRWNNAQKTFDCPCHGSRFNTDGEVIEGPSLQCLPRIESDSASQAEQEPEKKRATAEASRHHQL